MQKRRTFMKAVLTSGALLLTDFFSSGFAKTPQAQPNRWWETTNMDTLTAIRTRRSVRSFLNKKVPENAILEIIAAGTSAPSSKNKQPWHFIILNDQGQLSQIASLCKFTGGMAKAPVAVLVCADSTVSVKDNEPYWILDVSACIQNMLLATHALGLGSVWLPIYPIQSRIESCRAIVASPDHIIPVALLPIGYPADDLAPVNRYSPKKIHLNTW